MTTATKWLAAAATLALFAVLAVVLPKLALFVGTATLLAFIAMPELPSGPRRLARLLFAIAGAASGVAIVRFVVVVAVPSLVHAGESAQALNAVTRLREILLAQDAMRKRALVDPDGDHVGSAALVVELRGSVPLRGGAPLDPPLLNDKYAHIEQTPIGPAALVSGYFVIVCLPKQGGGLSAAPGDPVDEEAAERRFVAYAWPEAERRGPGQAFFIDEHDRILVSENRAGKSPRYASASFPPPCDAALDPKTASEWQPWRGKAPRSNLPGGD